MRRLVGLLCAVALGVAACGGPAATPAPTSSSSISATTTTTSSSPSSAAPTTPVTAPPLTSSTEVSTELTTAEPTAPSQPESESAATRTGPTGAETVVEPSDEPQSEPAPEPEPTVEQPPMAQPQPPPPADNGSPRSASGTVVVIDPGHNGANGAHPEIINQEVDAGFGQTKACNTTGTETNAGYPEHAFTWAVALKVQALLEAQGVTVILTRSDDDGVGPCVNERAAIGNDAHADAVVSIHGDGSSEGDRGFYAMTAAREPAGDAVAAQSLALARAVRDGLEGNDISPSNYLGSDGLWTRDDLGGLNLSLRPTTMVEMGNMRDSQDAALMKSSTGQQQMAQGIAAGILAFLGR